MQKLLIFAIGLFTLFPFTLRAQVLGVEYWFENNPFYRQTVLLTPDGEGNVNFKINPEQLTTGLHQLSIRVKDGQGRFSPVESHWFFKCEDWDVIDLNYWLDDEEVKHEANLIEFDGTHYGQFLTADLPSGFHKLSYTLKNGGGKISTVHQHWFYKSPHSGQTYFTYWIDDDVQNRQRIPVTTGELANLSIDVNNYPQGSHRINYTISDTDGSVSAVSTEWFTSGQNPNYDVSNLKVTDVKYWFNDLDEKPTMASVKSPDFEISLDTALSTGGVELGDNKMYYQFRNSAGLWSAVESTEFDATVAMPIEMNLVKLSPDINELVPATVKEYASVYYHYRFSDKNGKGIKGMRVKGKLDNSNELFLSQPSDTSGVVQLKVPVWGRNLDDKNDDLIKVYDTKNFRFDAALYPINTEPVLLKNEFIPKTIGVIPCIATEQTGTFTPSLGKSFDILDASLKVSPGFDFTYEMDDLGAIERMGYETSGEVSGSLKLKFPALKNINFGFSANYMNATEITMKDDPRAYLMAFYSIFSNYKKDENSLYVMSAIASFLESDSNPLNMETKYSQKMGIGMNAGYKNELSFLYNQKTSLMKFPISINGRANFTYSWGSLLDENANNNDFTKYALSLILDGKAGTDLCSQWATQLNNGLTQFDLFNTKSQYAFDLGLAYSLDFSYYKDKSPIFNSYNSLKMSYGLSNKVNLSIDGTSPKLNLNDLSVSGEIAYSRKTINTTSYGNGMLSYLYNSVSADVPDIFEKLKNLDNDIINVGLFVDNVTGSDKFLSSELNKRTYMQTDKTLKKDIHISSIKTNEASFTAGFPVKIFGLDLDFEAELSLKNTYPLLDSYYHVNSRKVLPTIIYKDFNKKENFTDFVKLDGLWSEMKNSLFSFKDLIWEKMKNIGHSITDYVNETSSIWTNYIRSYTSVISRYPQLRKVPQQNYSVFKFEVPDKYSAFNPNTKIDFKYFYTGGDIIGVSEQKDTFVVVSDVFYFNAYINHDTLKTAPNGNFKLTTTVGADDLALLELNPSSSVSVFYKSQGSKLWQNLGAANNTLSINGLGTYTLGVNIGNDTVPPNIIIDKQEGSKIVTAQITDNIGINWKTVNVVCNGIVRTFTKDINGILSFTLSDDEFDKELDVLVNVTDLARNTKQVQKSFNVLSGIENVINANYFILYPNPAKTTITIELPQAVMFDKIEILDITGKVMLKLNVINKQVIDINVFPRGVYFVRSGNYTRKFIKQ